MSYDTFDTIVAVCTPPGPSARGAVRLSGREAFVIAGRLVGCDLNRAAAGAVDVQIELPRTTGGSLSLLARALVWPVARSFTREPVVELHTIGSPPLLAAIVAQAVVCGARLAEPGEFTLRAFLAGRIDLTQAEAVLGVIDAGGPQALATALAQLAGGLATPLATAREDLLLLLADIEAGLDFVDEDIEFVTKPQIQLRLAHARDCVAALREQLADRGRADDLPQVVLTGPPNAGKSSLFNRLVSEFGREAHILPAIVSPVPGATRDALKAELCINGIAIVLCDTAGVNEVATGDNSIDAAAQAQSLQQRGRAELRIDCVPITDRSRCESSASELTAITMCDTEVLRDVPGNAVATSAQTGIGIDALARRIVSALETSPASSASLVVPQTLQRCGGSVAGAWDSLLRAQELLETDAGHELVAAELRSALEHLGAVAGTVSTDDVLDRVFSRFCIGK